MEAMGSDNPVAIETDVVMESAPVSLSCREVLSEYFHLSFNQLLEELENRELVELGFTRRDLALACLVAFHYFDVERAMSGVSLETRQVTFRNHLGGEEIGITLFPGLTDDLFASALHFARTEKWPLTAKGLFFELKGFEGQVPESLKEAFYLTSEYTHLSTLFSRSEYVVERDTLLFMALEGDWKSLKELKGEPSSSERQKTLLGYLDRGSHFAARLLVETERDFTLGKLTNLQLEKLLSLLQVTNEEIEQFLKGLLISVRSDMVRQKAGVKLFQMAGESAPEPYDHALALRRFELIPASTANVHRVEKGDTLWDISRKYKVKVADLRRLNQLTSDSLSLGQTLQIPPQG